MNTAEHDLRHRGVWVDLVDQSYEELIEAARWLKIVVPDRISKADLISAAQDRNRITAA